MGNNNFWDKGVMLVTGCTKVSPGCKNCWSETAHVRRSKDPKNQRCYNPNPLTDGRFNGKVQFNLYRLEAAAKVRKPTVYAIWNDLYHENVDISEVDRAIKIMEKSSHHVYLIVTKRPEVASKYYGFIPTRHWKPHIWHIVTCENQAMADKRIPHLLNIPGKRGIIIEPMLGAVDLLHVKDDFGHGLTFNALSSKVGISYRGENIQQVICGPENGAGKRPFDPAWADSVKAQCEAAGVPFYRKDTSTGELAWQ
jgi:protein gp37